MNCSHRGEAQGCRFASLVERPSFGGIDAGKSAYRLRPPHLNPLPQGRGGFSRLTDERSHRGEGCRFASLVERPSFGGIDAGKSAYRRRPPSPQSLPQGRGGSLGPPMNAAVGVRRRVADSPPLLKDLLWRDSCRKMGLSAPSPPHLNPLPQGRGGSLGSPMNAATGVRRRVADSPRLLKGLLLVG